MEYQLSHLQKDALFQHTYIKALLDNKNNLKKWNEYKAKYEDVKKYLTYYNEKHQHTIFLPVGSKAFVRGKLVHTNDVWVTLGAGWFVKTSSKKAIEICQRRIKSADELIEKWEKESKLLENMREYSKSKDAFAGPQSKDIVEPFDEERERIWQQEHREKEKKYRQQLKEIREKTGAAKINTEKDLWEHLEALELQEELEDELNRLGCDSDDDSSDEDEDSEGSSGDGEVQSIDNKPYFVESQENSELVGIVKQPSADGKPKLTRKKSVTFLLPEDEQKSETIPGEKNAVENIIHEHTTIPDELRDIVHEKKITPAAIADIIHEKITKFDREHIQEQKSLDPVVDSVPEKRFVPSAISDIVHENVTVSDAVSDVVKENVSNAPISINNNEHIRPMSKFKMNRK